MASSNGLQGAPSNLTLTIDGLSTIYSNGNVITGNYLNSNANTTNVNTQIQLQPGGQFDIDNSSGLSLFNINEINSITTIARAQMSGAPVSGNDLCNKNYVDLVGGNAIQKVGTTTGLNGNAVLSSVSGSTFSFSDGSGNTLVVYSQQNTAFYTSGGQFIIMNNSVLQSPYFIVNEFNGTQTLSHPMTPWTPIQGQDMVNKNYTDSSISSATANALQKTGSTGINGVFQLLASGSMLFQNSSGTSLLTLSGSGCGINNPLITGTTNLYTLYNTYGGSNQLLQIDSTGNLQNCPNLSYTYGNASSTILTTIPTAISGQLQTLQWILNTSSPQGWYLSTAYISKFPQTDIPITIPLLYSSSLTTTNTTTYNAITMNCNDTTAGTSMRMVFSHGTAGVLNSVIQSAVLSSSKTELRYYTQNSSLLWDFSMSYNETQAVLETPQSYLKINDATGNIFSTGSDGLSISTTAIRPNAPISYPTSTGNISLSAPQTGNSPQGGDRLVLWPGGSGVYSYALGMNGGTMWYNVPSGAIHQFYVGGVSTFYINGSGTTITSQGTGVELLTFYQSATASAGNFINIKFQHGSANNVNSYIQSSLLGSAVNSTLRFYTTASNVGKETFQMSATGALAILKSAQAYFQLQDSSTNAIYTNSNGINIDSTNGVFLSSTGGQTTFPQNIVIGSPSSSLQFGQMSTAQYFNNSVAWTGGYTLSGTFTKNSATSFVTLTGGVSMYCNTVANQSVNVRLTCSTGNVYTFTQTQFFNITSSHIFIPTNYTFTNLVAGTYTVYVYASGTGYTSDSNDYVNMTFRVVPF